MSTKKQIGKRIRRLRLAAGLSIEDLARLANRTYGTVQGAETGRHRPHRDTLAAIARALGTTPEELE